MNNLIVKPTNRKINTVKIENRTVIPWPIELALTFQVLALKS